jgi:peptide deformylase
LEAFNVKYNANIAFKECDKKVSLNNSWLSGFTDAEGCFTCSAYLSKLTNKHIVTVRYVVSLASGHENDIEFSKYLAVLIKGYVTHVKRYNGYNTVVKHSKLNTILKYFNIFPLKTKKHISYLRWLKIYTLVKDKKHLNSEGIEKIKNLIKLINT